MSVFYFDAKDGFVTVNGALAEKCYCTDRAFALACFRDGFEPVFAKICVPPASAPLGTRICDLGGGIYLLSSDPLPAPCTEPQIICQTVCRTENVSHLVTSCKRGGYYLIAETDCEIHEFPCPCALTDVKVVSARVAGGQLIKITAKAEKRKFAAVLFYGDDYVPLFSGVYDDLYFEGADIVCIEKKGGCNCCERTLRLCYSDGRFSEKELSFSYAHDHLYVDELVPYVFLEKLIFEDIEGAENMLRRGLSAKSVLGTMGDFDSVADFEFLPYRPFVVGVYEKTAFCKVRYFRFYVRDGVICDVYPVL